MARPTPRDSVALMEGYHSPQIDVAVRLNTNEAPEPPPAAFVEGLAAALADVEWHRYPDRSASVLRERIAQVERPLMSCEIGVGNVFVANGSNEVLQTLCLTYGGPERIALTNEPTYALHQHIARIAGTEVLEVERLANFELDLETLLEQIDSAKPSIVFLCSPNNPTGLVEEGATVEAVLAAVEAIDGLLVVDEAYGQFAPWSALSLVDEERSIVVTRTFSKTWSAAGLRLGYLIGPSWVVAELEKVVLPYHLDSMKQLAGTLALEHLSEMEARVASLVEERGRVEAALAELPVDQWPSGANFILFRPRAIDGDVVWAELVERSVLVRNCSSWPRLEGCLRVTLGTREEDDEFLKSLAEVLSS
ncbi:MAG TPA: histidinol-phosphate transaminase [Microthrixaceae bacterium]|nr:histidinol-phosphate transaminase [Microthrixaceae bacterium]